MILFSNMRIEDLPDYRKEKGLTQQQVADLMGTVQPAVARFEKVREGFGVRNQD